MRAGLTRDKIRAAVCSGLDSGCIPTQTLHEIEAQRLERLQAVQGNQYLAGYQDYLGKVQRWRDQGIDEDPIAPWQWRQLPALAG